VGADPFEVATPVVEPPPVPDPVVAAAVVELVGSVIG
jgi:hypothetical protein